MSLTNSTFEACEYYGVRARGEVWFHEFADNVFRDNGREALRIPAMAMGALDERSTYDGGNGHDRVKIYGNEIMADVTLSPLDVTYYFTDSVRLDEPVTIEGGTDLRFDGGRTIGAEGPEFVVDGSEEAPVTFDKAADADGHWGGIEVAPDCVASFGHCTITNGGQDTGNLYVSAGGYAIIESLSVANSATNGIYAERESDLNETGNSTYSGNSECDIYYDDSDVCIEQ